MEKKGERGFPGLHERRTHARAWCADVGRGGRKGPALSGRSCVCGCHTRFGVLSSLSLSLSRLSPLAWQARASDVVPKRGMLSRSCGSVRGGRPQGVWAMGRGPNPVSARVLLFVSRASLLCLCKDAGCLLFFERHACSPQDKRWRCVFFHERVKFYYACFSWGRLVVFRSLCAKEGTG